MFDFFQEQIIKHAGPLVDLLGGVPHVMRSKRRAEETNVPESILVRGWLLGGRLELKLTFDPKVTPDPDELGLDTLK
jgi:hypothetical protein